jgi:hypothetical protein
LSEAAALAVASTVIELGRVNRLDHVVIKPGFLGATTGTTTAAGVMPTATV